MANRERKNELKIYLSDDEQYILKQKVKASGIKSKSAFLRRSKGVDEKSVGYTKVHALKTAIHKAVDRN